MGFIHRHTQSHKSFIVRVGFAVSEQFRRSFQRHKVQKNSFIRRGLLLCCALLFSSLPYAAEIEKPLALKNTVSLQESNTQQTQDSILVLGDSISAAFGLNKEKGWVALLQQELGERYNVINASISGDTTTGGRYRLPKALSTHQPSIVIIELGGNDGLRGTPIKQIRQNIESMIKMSRDAGAKPVLLGMMIPPNYGERYTKAFSSVYSELAEQFQVPLVPFLLDGVAGVDGMMQEDGIHPTEAAQGIMLQHVQLVLAKLIQP